MGKLEMMLRRPTEFSVVVERGPDSKDLGFALEHSPTGYSLLVQNLKDGLIIEWNQLHPDNIVQCGDRIISVNGVCGLTDRLMRELVRKQKLTLVFRRPFPRESTSV